MLRPVKESPKRPVQITCHPAKALHKVLIRRVPQLLGSGNRDDRVEASPVRHLIDFLKARLACLSMIWFQRLDGGKNNVGFAILHPRERNFEEQVPAVENSPKSSCLACSRNHFSEYASAMPTKV